MSEKKKEKNTNKYYRYQKDYCIKVLNKTFMCAFFILIFIFILCEQLNKYPTNLDELWNYNTARCIKNGLIPYKDISMITTPLFPTIVAICLKIFGDNLFVFRIIGAVLFTLILIFTYKIFYELLKKQSIAIIFTGIICFALFQYFMVDYNFFVLLISLIIEYLELKIYCVEQKRHTNNKETSEQKYTNKINIWEQKRHTNKKQHRFFSDDLLIGILAGLAICSKQTLGFFILIYVLLINLLFIRNKDDWKVYLKTAMNRLIGAFIPSLMFLIFLAVTKSYDDFISYAILGIRTFTNSIPYRNLIQSNVIITKILAIIIPFFVTIMIACSFYLLRKLKKDNKIKENKTISDKINDNRINQNKTISNKVNDNKIREIKTIENKIKYKKIIIATFSGIPMLITIYPIADDVHFYIAVLQFSILLLYILAFLCVKLLKKIIEYDKIGKVFNYIIENKVNVFVEKFIVTFVILLGILKMVQISLYNYEEYKSKLLESKSIVENENIENKNIEDVNIENKNIEDVNIENNNIEDVNIENNKGLFKHFKKIPLTTGYIKLTQELYDFYKENNDKKIIIVDAEACVYDIPMDIYNKNFDMFLKGNIGKDGEEGIIKNIENSTNTIYLIKKEGAILNWQTPKSVIEYIRKNMKKLGSIKYYDIYCKQ